MTFAAPWMLVGLLAVALPLWLHLQRRRREAILFPPAALLARVARRRYSSLRLRSLVLLAARVLAIVALVLAASRPGITVRRPGGIRSGAPLALAIVLDDSLSMRLTDSQGRSVFERARRLALAELARLRSGDAAVLVLGFESADHQIETNAPDRLAGEALRFSVA